MARLAVYHAKLGEDAEARRVAEEALSLAPTTPDVLYYVAVAYTLGGNAERAQEVLTQALQAGFSPELARDDDDLSSLRELPAYRRLLQSEANTEEVRDDDAFSEMGPAGRSDVPRLPRRGPPSERRHVRWRGQASGLGKRRVHAVRSGQRHEYRLHRDPGHRRGLPSIHHVDDAGGARQDDKKSGGTAWLVHNQCGKELVVTVSDFKLDKAAVEVPVKCKSFPTDGDFSVKVAEGEVGVITCRVKPGNKGDYKYKYSVKYDKVVIDPDIIIKRR